MEAKSYQVRKVYVTCQNPPVQMLELGAIFPTQMGQNKAADHQGWVLINNNKLLAYYLQGCQFLG